MPKIAKEIQEDKYGGYEPGLISRFVDYVYVDSPDWVAHVMFLVPLSIGMFIIFHEYLGF